MRRRQFVVLAGVPALGLLAGCDVLAPQSPTPVVVGPDATAIPPKPTSAPPAGATPTRAPAPTATLPAVSPRADGYIATLPKTLRSGQTERVAVSLFDGQRMGADNVRLLLMKGTQTLAEGGAPIQGTGNIPIQLPVVADGDYDLVVKGSTFQDKAAVKIEDGTIVFVESDKPIYKPGQVVHIRVLTLDPQLRPWTTAVTVEVADASGTKIFRKEAKTDDYGMLSLDLPLSPEPNLGVWKILARTAKRTAQLDVRIERYVLPKYEVKVNLAKDWLLVSERIKGTVSAEYSYGKPVQGEMQIVAKRYVGRWEEFANIRGPISGTAQFDIPEPKYVTGVPGAKGQGNVQLDVTVREKATDYEEKTTRLLTVAANPVTVQVLAESVTFKPGLPLGLIVIVESPDRKPADAEVTVQVTYVKANYTTSQERLRVSARGGKAMLKVNPPTDAAAVNIVASTGNASASMVMQAGYSPSGAFVHLEQVSAGDLAVGGTARFRVTATKEATGFYHEVIARGTVVQTSYTDSREFELVLTPAMAPTARVVVYQVLQTSEVAADYLPLTIAGRYPQQITAAFGKDEVKPADKVDVNLQTEGPARVGIAAVDRSVFILAENRVNLQQVFAELERLYQQPQVELHSASGMNSLATRGAKEVFQDAGLVVLSNKQVPQGKELAPPPPKLGVAPAGAPQPRGVPEAAVPAAAPAAEANKAADAVGQLAEPERTRQFFPETWLWSVVDTDAAGKGRVSVQAPDSITTWMLRAVALSKSTGLGIAEAQLRVLQPFFVQLDLPYAVIRGEEFPVRVALYNYSSASETFVVELAAADWFDLVGPATQSVTVGAGDLGASAFTVRARALGTKLVKVTARSRTMADALQKELIVEPEGVAREVVDNLILTPGQRRELDVAVPAKTDFATLIEGSGRAYAALCGNYLTQTIEGLDALLRMPFGCGEQNMILFAPNVFVTKYLKDTGQVKPEIMAKAETMMITGYQRELIYRRSDASFSAFGNSDPSGSLWLTAFVLKTFSQAKGLIYIDDAVLSSARAWISKQQKSDGGFEPVGFVHHQDMLGGVKGKPTLTAYIAGALIESGDTDSASTTVRQKAISYLEGQLSASAVSSDPYAMALITYVLEMAKSARATEAYDNLRRLATVDNDVMYWTDVPSAPPTPAPVATARAGAAPVAPPPQRFPVQTLAVEATAYGLLALLKHGDRVNAAKAARWLAGKRNAQGGFGSTQDTVVALQALAEFATQSRFETDATVALTSGTWRKEVRLTGENADVMQSVDVPLGGTLVVDVTGKGQPVLQLVRRYNVAEAEAKPASAFRIDVNYNTTQVEVNDTITIEATVEFAPPTPMQAGMVVLDIAVPTGFAPVPESLDALKGRPKFKRYDIAGRKVVIYLEDMTPGERLTLAFKARALYPVRAQPVTSQAYSYYNPDMKGESLGKAVVVGGR